MVYVNYFTSFCDIKLTMITAKQVGSIIKEARKAQHLTQQQVAKIMLMTQQQYSRFENGVFELNYNQIVKICEILNISPNELFGFE